MRLSHPSMLYPITTLGQLSEATEWLAYYTDRISFEYVVANCIVYKFREQYPLIFKEDIPTGLFPIYKNYVKVLNGYPYYTEDLDSFEGKSLFIWEALKSTSIIEWCFTRIEIA